MSPKLVLLAAAGLVLPTAALAFDFDPAVFSFSGFGTIGTVHSSEDRADFTSSVLQPNGAGFTRSWSFDVDTLLGLQANAKLSDKLQAVVQVVAQQRLDNSYTPEIEWANLKYSFTKDFSVRAGRIAMPTYMASEIRNVHYALLPVRPSPEIYRILPVTNSDGFDASYKFRAGSVINTTQVIYGNNTITVVPGLDIKTAHIWGIYDTVQWGNLKMHFGLQSQQLHFYGPLAPPFPSGIPYKIKEAGFTYDANTWVISGEWAESDFELGSTRGTSLHGGYRVNDFTPYIGIADIRPRSLTTLAPSSEQTNFFAGVRWDFMSNFALKAQYEHLDIAETSSGTLVNVQPGFQPGGTVDVLSVAINFVF
jgi:hypothetical protein